ncbi:DUF4349 domain-containing protein [Hymenobacter setariae]|uniref:DUF4349 domain-containing protein n=1 Tax=Hymenobacter setariae TaxID=2594794 RepID=A0A558C2E8_9BACT|nr:DUF4349 domain-containing protein [Hymenobacter setariae]TVT42980.1 DUF4349 domain-containing protein [Hymenobacter setariae]
MKCLIYPALLGLALAGCSQQRSEQEVATAPETTVSQSVIKQAPTPVETAVVPPVVARRPDRDIVYQGELNLAVDSFEQVSASVNRLLVQHDSFLATAHEERANGQQRQEMTIKVPPKEFASLVAALSRLGHVENKDIASTDVTADLLQATASLDAKKTSLDKYQQLARAASPAEARRFDEQARQLRTDLAADQARLQQLGARSAWATLTLRFYQVLPAPEPTVPVPAFAPQFSAAFYRGWSVVLSILVALTNFWPLALLGGVAAWAVRRWQRRQAAEL